MFDRVSDIIEIKHNYNRYHNSFAEHATKSTVFNACNSPNINISLLDDANDLEKSIADAHAKCVTTVHDVGFYILTNFILRGRGFLFSDKRLLDRRDLIPDYVRAQIDNGKWGDLYPQQPLPIRRISKPALLLTSEAYFIYGHWLVDSLPKAWLYKTMFNKEIDDLTILLPHDIPPFALNILIDIFKFNPTDFEYYRWREEDLLLDAAIVPSLLHDSHIFHPATNLYVEYVLSQCVTGGIARPPNASNAFEDGDLIYVSRHQFKDKTMSSKRSISNEESVHSVLQTNGFKIVCPEELTWVEQVKLFSRARVIVGESGSGLHNAIFCGKHSVVLCFRPSTHVQATIGGLREHNLVLLCPTEEENNNGITMFKIDEQRLAAALNTCKNLALRPYQSV